MHIAKNFKNQLSETNNFWTLVRKPHMNHANTRTLMQTQGKTASLLQSPYDPLHSHIHVHVGSVGYISAFTFVS